MSRPWFNSRNALRAGFYCFLVSTILNCQQNTTLKGTAPTSQSNIETPQSEDPKDEPPPPIESLKFSLDTPTRDMSSVNSNRWTPSFLPGFGSDEGADVPGHFAFVATGIRTSDQNSWENKYLESSFGLPIGTQLRFQVRFHVNDALQARNNAPNTRAQIRDCHLLTLKKNGTWQDQSNLLSQKTQSFASWYGNSASPNSAITSPVIIGEDEPWKKRDESYNGGGSSYGWIGYGNLASGLVSLPLLYDGWSLMLDKVGLSEDASLNEQISQVLGRLTYCQARLILHDPLGNDDRAESHLIMNAVGEYYNMTRGGLFIGEAFHGRFKAITNEWQAFSATDLSAATLAQYPPPQFE